MKELALLALLLPACGMQLASPEETACGWLLSEVTTLPENGRCWTAEPGANGAVTAPDAQACDVERAPYQARAGETVALWSRVGALSETRVRWRGVDCDAER